MHVEKGRSEVDWMGEDNNRLKFFGREDAVKGSYA